MADIVITAASVVAPQDVGRFRFGIRFGRLDPFCQLGLVAVEALGIDFSTQPRSEVAICVATNAGSLSTDVQYWQSRNEPGGVSPTLFVYTLPSTVIGEIAIRHGLTGPDLCLIGGSAELLDEAADLLRRNEAAVCLAVYCDVVSSLAAETIRLRAEARACAAYLQRGGSGGYTLTKNDRDMISLCARLCSLREKDHHHGRVGCRA
jgi:3-oxoacyl-(acyl-carrier-protein) synthase